MEKRRKKERLLVFKRLFIFIKSRKINKSLVKKILIFTLSILFVAWFVLRFLLVVSVNGYPINRFWLDRQLEKQAGKQMAENQIRKILIWQEARKNSVNVTAEEIGKKLAELKTQVEGQGATLESLLRAQGLTEKDLREEIGIQLLVEKIFGKDVKISDEEIVSYFNDNTSQFAKGASLESVKEQIRMTIFQNKLRSEFQTRIEDLRQKASIRWWMKM